ncbi:MAG: TIGR03768 family metallophosphoesterase [Deltaproteobacteria bacterium]|nr:TIGR03768 family metallophosphoesterase [Deltaproteobacteria bacterium]
MAKDDPQNSSDSKKCGGITRRNFMKYSAMTVAYVSLGPLTFGCGDNGGQLEGYPIDPNVVTTVQKTVAFTTPNPVGLTPTQLSSIPQYSKYSYGVWKDGPPLLVEPRTDIMSPSYSNPSPVRITKFMNCFAISDIHITDKETPNQLIYLQQLNANDAQASSVYSPVMMYTTHVLDAMMQTVNALHSKNPFDFGISLGDACNSTQYNELRWYIDVIDGKTIIPSSGSHVGSNSIDYQKPYQAAGLDKSIRWYQALGNHDHFWIGSFPVDMPGVGLRQAYISDTVFATGDVLADPRNINNRDYYMGVIDGSTPLGDIIDAGPVGKFKGAPTVVADQNRRSLLRTEWIQEFFNTSTEPVGHGFNLVDPNQESGFACYSFVPKSNVPLKVIVLDNTQMENDNSPDIHGHGFLDQARWTWLKKELAAGQAADQLMIIAAHVPIGIQPINSEVEWWADPQNAVSLQGLLTELQSCPNLLLWMTGHRHTNTVKAFKSPDPVNAPEKGFWQVETTSLRDFPQQLRTFEIYLNSDYTISIVTINVDPAVKEGTPAATSRKYAVATQQILNTLSKFQNDPSTGYLVDPITQQVIMNGSVPAKDPSIHPMPTGSYNAELFKQLSPDMVKKLKALYPKP